MDINFEQKVREKAYEIWVSAGMTDGMAHEHWATAEQAVANETAAPKKKIAAKAVTASAKKSPAKPAAKAVEAKKPAAKASKTAKPVRH